MVYSIVIKQKTRWRLKLEFLNHKKYNFFTWKKEYGIFSIKKSPKFKVDTFYLNRYATEVDVDFVRKSVRAIGRCAIKVEPAAERCVSTLLDLIQTKVNYVVQEAIVVIKVQPNVKLATTIAEFFWAYN